MHFEKRNSRDTVLWLFTGLLVSVLLLGAGCKREEASVPPQDSGQPVSDASEPVQDSGPEIPEGWRVYRSASFTIAYPSSWYAQSEALTNPSPPDLERVVFDTRPIPTGEQETEPVYLAMLEVGSGDLETKIARYAPFITRSVRQVGQRAVTRFTYEDDFMGGTPVAYVFEEYGRVYLLLRVDGDDAHLETMVQTLRVL